MFAGKSPEWLPAWFTERIKVKDGRKIKVYTDTSTGNKFYSRPAVTRYLETVNQSDTTTKKIKLDVEDESSSKSEISPQIQLEVEDEPSSRSGVSPPRMPIASPGCNSERKNKGKHSFEMVTGESESADGIPPGWIIEIKRSKSGNKIRSDRYYIDPNTRYVFCSKKDVTRYLETRDISNCATKPKKMESGDLQLIKNEIHSSSQDNKLSEYIEAEQLLAPGEPDSGVETSSAKSPEAPDTEMKIDSEPTDENESRENLTKDAKTKMHADLTKKVKATDQKLANTDSETRQMLPSSGIRKQADEALVSSSKSKKRKSILLPSRASKRLAGYEAEIQSDLITSKGSLGVAAMGSASSEVKTLPSSVETVADIPLSSGLSPLKEVATLTVVVNATPQAMEPPKNFEKPLVEKETIRVQKQSDDSTRSQKSQLCFGFGNSWSDPCLEFAFKTLTEIIPYEETLASVARFRKRSRILHNQSNGFSRPSDSDLPRLFRSEIPTHSEPLKHKVALDLSRDKSTTFSASSGVSSQQSMSEARNKDCPNVPANGTKKQAAKPPVSRRKSKKRENQSLASQTSEKLAWSGIATRFKVDGEKTLRQAIPDNKFKPKGSAISEESELCYEFSNSWLDPCLDFAFKTLTGELPIEETFAFSGRVANQSGSPYNQATDPIKPSESVVPNIFPNDIPRHSDQLKKNSIGNLLHGSFPACSGLSSQQSHSEARGMEYKTKVVLESRTNNFNFQN